MNLSQSDTFINFRANTNTTEYSAAVRLINLNRWMHKVHTAILESLDGWDFDDSNRSDYPVATSNLVASQQDYTFPTDLLKIKRVEAKLDNATWLRVAPLDINQVSTATDTTSLASNFSNSAPYYDVEATAIKLYPIPSVNVTAGLKIWYVREMTDITSSDVTTGTKEFGFAEPFHTMIPLGMCYDYFVAKGLSGKAQEVWLELQDYEARLKKFYGAKQLDDSYRLSPAYQDYN